MNIRYRQICFVTLITHIWGKRRYKGIEILYVLKLSCHQLETDCSNYLQKFTKASKKGIKTGHYKKKSMKHKEKQQDKKRGTKYKT